MWKQSLLGGCASIGLMALPSAVHAQAVEAEQPVVSSVEAITVTALRRESLAQDTPLSVTSVGGERLEERGIENIQQLDVVVPSLTMSRGGSNLQPSIRGVTTAQSVAGTDQPVGVYLDGVYQAHMKANVTELPDVERIEVLRGPQGTLFGRNTMGGAVLIATKRPDVTAPALRTSVRLGTYTDGAGAGELSHAVNFFGSAPVVEDTLAVSLAIAKTLNGPYLRDIATDDAYGEVEQAMVRGKLLWQPAPGAQFLLTGFYTERDDRIAQSLGVEDRNTVARFLDPTVAVPTGFWDIAFDSETPPYFDYSTHGFNLHSEFEFDAGNLNAISAWYLSKAELSADVDGTDMLVFTSVSSDEVEVFSQEVNFASRQFGPFSFVTGLYYYHNFNYLALNGSFVKGAVITDAWAAYGEGTYELTDRLSVLAGIRFSREKKALEGEFGAGCGASFCQTTASERRNMPFIAEKSWDDISPRLSFIYELNDEINAYVTYSEGFKSGAFASFTALTPQTVDPEHITAYEVGLKGWVLPKLYLEAAAFHYLWEDIQLQSFVPPSITVANAAESEINGAEIQGVWRATPDLSFTGTVSYIPTAEYTSFPDAQFLVPRTDSSGTPLGGNLSVIQDGTGYRLNRVPEYTASIAADYVLNLQDRGVVRAHGSVYHSAEYVNIIGNYTNAPAYTMVNARVGWAPDEDSPWEFSVWGNNLLNAEWQTSANPSTLSFEYGAGTPRQIGVGVSYAFN